VCITHGSAASDDARNESSVSVAIAAVYFGRRRRVWKGVEDERGAVAVGEFNVTGVYTRVEHVDDHNLAMACAVFVVMVMVCANVNVCEPELKLMHVCVVCVMI
jgi:hypothetical protein